MAPVVSVATPRLRRAAGLLGTYRDAPMDLVDALLVASGHRRRSIVRRPLPPGLTPLRLKSLSVVYALVPGRWAAEDVFSATAARMRAFNAFS